MTARLPPRVGRYEIKGELGRGKMGVVYEAHDTTLGRDLALKTIRLAESASDEERSGYEKRFMTEARVAARLSHPGIVVVHDVGRDPQTGLLYLAFERLHGQTLDERLAGGKALPWREAFRLAKRLADALHHAHAQGVIHRDIKPANIMVLPSGDPKIMDFGIAKAPASQLTRAGEIFGTPAFMSPEQARGRALDHRSDLFSLGAVLYQMLTGTKAFQAPSTVATLTAVIDSEPQAPSRLARDLPADADYVTARALAKQPANRYPDGRTLSDDLADILEGRPPRHRAGWLAKGAPAATPPKLPSPEPTDEPTTLVLESLDEVSTGEPTKVVAAKKARAAADVTPRRSTLLPLVALMAGVGLAFVAGAWWLLRGHAREDSALATESAPTASPSPIGTVMPGVPPPSAAPSPPAASPSARPSPTPTRRSVPVSPSPTPRASAPSTPPATRPTPTTSASPAARKPVSRPSFLALDFEHSLESGTMQVWVDGDLAFQQQLTSQATRKLLVVRKRKGTLNETLELRPGQHLVRVQVSWEDEERTGTISGPFEAGATRSLAIRLSGRRKTLSLAWR